VIHFLDASALVKRYVQEPGTDDIRRLVRGRSRLAASALSLVEIPSACGARRPARSLTCRPGTIRRAAASAR
jgi:predicted nucleic acid-binding protein